MKQNTDESTCINSCGSMKSKDQSEGCSTQYLYRKEARYQLSNLSFHLHELGKEQNKSKASRRKKIKIEPEIDEVKNRKPMEKTNKTDNSFSNRAKK